jgi:hypothetical protein
MMEKFAERKKNSKMKVFIPSQKQRNAYTKP